MYRRKFEGSNRKEIRRKDRFYFNLSIFNALDCFPSKLKLTTRGFLDNSFLFYMNHVSYVLTDVFIPCDQLNLE